MSRPRKIWKWLLGSLVALAIVVGLLFATFGYIVGRVPEYRVQLQDWIGERSGLIVEFRTLSARLRLYGPELVFDDAVVRTPDRTRTLFVARRGSIGFDLWNSIANGRLTAARFVLDAPEIALIRTSEGKIQLLGQSALPERDIKPIALEQLPTGRFVVHEAVVSFRDEITGRGPWSLSGVNFELTRSVGAMEVHGDASLPPALGEQLKFSASADGKIEASSDLLTTFSVQGQKLDLAGWADLLPDAWPAPESGHGTIQIDGALKGAELVELSGNVDLAQLASVLPMWATPLPVAAPLQPPVSPDDPPPKPAPKHPIEPELEALAEAPALPPQVLSYSRLAFKLHAQKADGQWALTVSDLDATRSDSSWQAKQLSARWSRGEPGTLNVSGDADRVALDNIWPLLAYLPESQGLARLRAMHAKGWLSDVKFSFARTAPDTPATYSVESKIDDLAFSPVLQTPGLSGISGSVQANDQSGQLQLAAKQLTFELPRMFRSVLDAASAEGVISWQRNDTGLVVSTDQLRVTGEDGRAVARMHLSLPRDGSSPVLDLVAKGEDLKVASTHKYLPADKMGPKTLEWFDQALQDGRISTADFQYKGPMRSFPFRKNEGTFLARAQVHDALFDYQPGWQPARELAAEVEFRNQGMKVHATAGTIGNVRLNQATAAIPDLKLSEISIDANTGGDLDASLAFLRDSPIGPRLGETFARLGGRGAMTADVRLELPLKRLDDRKIDVTAHFADATVTMQKVSAPVQSLTGELTVKNTLIASADLKGRWLGGPLAVKIEQQSATAAQLEAKGHAESNDLRTMFALPAAVKLSGGTDWHMSMPIASGDSEAARRRNIKIDSNLRGLGIQLPEPLGKASSDERSLQVALEIDDEQILTRTAYGDVRGLIRMRQGDGGWDLDRGGVRADAVAPSLPGHRGLRIEGTVQRFVLDDWLALRGDSPAPGTPVKDDASKLSDFLQAANVRVNDFQLFGYQFPDVRGVLQSTQSGWRVDVSGDNAAGQVLIPESFTGSQPLRATMDRLVINKVPSQDDAPKAEDSNMDPRNLPNMQVYVASMQLGNRVVGAVDLKATRVPQGIRFDNATILAESARADAQGQWLNTVDGQHSTLAATIESKDVAATLKALNYTPFIEAKRGAIKADLAWHGGYDDNILEHASGAIRVEAETGQLVNLQPGAGRVLGLFSVGALPRRLALDFSDLTEKGLAFDTVRGDFELRDGNAYTSNLLLRGPAAEIGIAGRTGLGTRDYDQTAVVTGNLGASLPVAGALAGGPVVGAAILLFSQVFKEPLKGITRGYYRITGPWEEPVVERVDAAEAKAEVAGSD
ncbi:YhdP family protein [Steroidobacter sp.]|uniref:YhdP family protein n=1 Tax=Steroidobacter sp. TaxID=1978227 RepID=UPI001A59F4E4|nr:YhdP family protein [Steroidobacter sp.]MBL8265072.1 TIGR02099 family protein [Steroidobacter sp.]